LFQIRLLLDLCLVEAVDDGVLALRDEDALDLETSRHVAHVSFVDSDDKKT
jgi:hypothetical protein